jgi:hypothetical protein
MGTAATARVGMAATAAIFLLLMDRVTVSLEKVPVPGDCSPTPYRRSLVAGESSEDDSEAASPLTGGLHLDCLLSAINSEAERTNFSVIPAEHTVSLTVRCADDVARSTLEPNGFRSLVWLEELGLEQCNLDLIPPRAFVGLTRLRTLKERSQDLLFVLQERN